jgi:ferredoxin
MPTIEFEGAGLGGDKLVEVPEGGELLDICDRVFAPVAFSCRSATCGTCHIEVVQGAELLEPPNDEERELLELIRGPASGRLACQARVRPGAGYLHIRPVLP